jgi:hypothetical protein
MMAVAGAVQAGVRSAHDGASIANALAQIEPAQQM